MYCGAASQAPPGARGGRRAYAVVAGGDPSAVIIDWERAIMATVPQLARSTLRNIPGRNVRVCKALAFVAMAMVTRAAPCDIYAEEGTPCVGAFSLVRALFRGYSGPLYVVRRASDNTTKAVPVITPGGLANASVQDEFCAGTDCTVWRLVDQSEYNNDLTPAPPGGTGRHPDNGVNASALPVRLSNGSRAYGALFLAGENQGYRLDITNGVAVGNEAETIYMVTSGRVFNDRCCFDFGNAEANNDDTGEGSMEAVYFGTWNATNKGWCGGVGDGPWVMADLESGIWACADRPATNRATLSNDRDFVTAMVKGFGDVAPRGRWMIRAGDAAKGKLVTQFDGPRPTQAPGRAAYYPMRLTGSIILGIGGDNSDGASGAFFEGCLLQGASSGTADAAVQANINSFYSELTLPKIAAPPHPAPSPSPSPRPPDPPHPVGACKIEQLTNDSGVLNHYCQTHSSVVVGGYCTVTCPNGEKKTDKCIRNHSWAFKFAQLCQ